MLLQRRILQEKDELEKRIAHLEQQIADAPAGNLLCYKNSNRYKFFQETVDAETHQVTRKYLRKTEADKIFALGQKSLDRARLHDYRQELFAVQSYLRHHVSSEERLFEKQLQSRVFQGLSAFTERLAASSASKKRGRTALPEDGDVGQRSSDILDPDLLARELSDWQKAEFASNQDFPNELIVKGPGDLLVRSKSEAFIAFSLESRHIPYRYECELILGNQHFYPDFTIRHPETGTLIIWEHFGMMDNQEYLMKTAGKVRTYMLNGFVPNKNLLMTFESKNQPLDFQEVSFLIDHFIL